MFRRLVQNIRNGHPEYLARPFEVAELYQHLVPYRLNRRELGIETNQDYEAALCQLLAGERGYLTGDEDMQSAIRREIASANPNTAVFREFAASRVALSPAAVQQLNEMPAAPSGAPTLSTPPTPRASIDSFAAGHAHPPKRAAAAPSAGTFASQAAPSAASNNAGNSAAAPSARQASSPSASSAKACAYCGGRLPAGREAAFCPHCGQNLRVQRCPACGSELDVNWRFCITCGRGVAST
ncbi:MAG TPA: zinc ribbon domain-containing protein [Gemmatimonadaceae bacterium]|nr:zinc ribbon domain-containing protein [Gemmatimonadaceae bacterium]